MTDDRETRLLSDAETLAWAVVLTVRARQERDGVSILLLPYPPCPTCGASVQDAKQTTQDDPALLITQIRLDVQPCGHSHQTTSERVDRVWSHIYELASDVASGYHGHATEARTWTTDEIVREADARMPEPRLLDCGLCHEEQGEEVHPHPECRAGKSDAPLVGFARIGLRVEPGFVDGVTAASWSKEPIPSDADSALMPNVEINGARSLALKYSRRVFAGDEEAQIFVDGRRYGTSSAHPVVVEPFGPGDAGAFVTLTLIADKVTVDGKEVGND